jgi:hypothetical protein
MIAQFVIPYDHLHLDEVDGMEGILERPLHFYSADLGMLVIAPEHMATDFASIPRFLWSPLLPKRGKHDRAAVLHDAGYRGFLTNAAGRELMLPKDSIDRLFLEAMRVAGVWWLPRVLMFRAVVIFGGEAFTRARLVHAADPESVA